MKESVKKQQQLQTIKLTTTKQTVACNNQTLLVEAQFIFYHSYDASYL